MKKFCLILVALVLSSGSALAEPPEIKLFKPTWVVQTGELIQLPSSIERNGKNYSLKWSITSRPEGSFEVLTEAPYTLEKEDSTLFTDVSGKMLEFVPDLPGNYEFKAEITQAPGSTSKPPDEDVNPDNEPVVETYNVDARGEPMFGGCSTASSPGTGLLFFGLAVVSLPLLRRRRRRISQVGK